MVWALRALLAALLGGVLCCGFGSLGGCARPQACKLPCARQRDVSRFELAWREDFEHGFGRASLGDWTFPTNEVEFVAANAALDAGQLALRLSAKQSGQGHTDRKYVGAEYDRAGAQTYGRFLARMRPWAPPGVITAFFTGLFDFDAHGKARETAEIDLEFVGTTRAVQFAMHWVDDAGREQQHFESVALDFDAGADFHVWEIEWLPERVVFYVDDRELFRFTDPAELAQIALPQEVKANVWISSEAGWAGRFDPASLPATTAYDWMEVHSLRD
jgi:beta-glucanase (GH16 family)